MAKKLVRGNVEEIRWSVPLAGVPTDGSTAVSVESEWLQKGERNLALNLIWTGTTEGTLTIQLSNDGTNVAATLAVSDFTPAMTNPAGGASSTCCQLTTSYPFVKVAFARSGGTGKITGTATAMR